MKLVSIVLFIFLVFSCQSTRKSVSQLDRIIKQRQKIDEKGNQTTKRSSLYSIAGALNVNIIQEGNHVKFEATVIRDLDSADGGSIGMFVRVTSNSSSVTNGDNIEQSALITNYVSKFPMKFICNLTGSNNGFALINGKDIAYIYRGEKFSSDTVLANAAKDTFSYAAFMEGSTPSLMKFRVGEKYILFEFDWGGTGEWEIVTPSMNTPALIPLGCSKWPYIGMLVKGVPENEFTMFNLDN